MILITNTNNPILTKSLKIENNLFSEKDAQLLSMSIIPELYSIAPAYCLTSVTVRILSSTVVGTCSIFLLMLYSYIYRI
jgi:hypothetical protein